MFHKEKHTAITLRKEGKSYSEILQKVPVAKSTLSLWLREVGLSAPQKQRLTEKRIQSALKGARARRTKRESSTKKIFDAAKSEIGEISDQELFLTGVVLYWAEGSKQKPYTTSTGVIFANSDPAMMRLFLRWLKLIGIEEERISYELYIHETARERLHEIKLFWSKILGTKISMLSRVYFKKNQVKNRRNIGREYHGLVRIKVSRSTDLNRRITGWISGICEKFV